ncbi:hypothetical protein [Clostridium sp.]|uniref:hypothetical protein n=1 Tax=Clostridium sp. TaxID=1506 RepID=UPI0039904A7C
MNKLIENNENLMYEVCLALDVFEEDTKVIVFKEWRDKSILFVTRFLMQHEIEFEHMENLFYLKKYEFIKVSTLYELLEELLNENQRLLDIVS